MPRVKVHVNTMFNPIGVRLLLGEIGVIAPMLQEENCITTVMSEDQISRFRNSRGAAHMVEILPEPKAEPEPAPEPEDPGDISEVEGLAALKALGLDVEALDRDRSPESAMRAIAELPDLTEEEYAAKGIRKEVASDIESLKDAARLKLKLGEAS